MARTHDMDPARPSLEFYRSQTELLLFLPVRRTTADPVNLSMSNTCNALCLSANMAQKKGGYSQGWCAIVSSDWGVAQLIEKVAWTVAVTVSD